MTLGGRRSRYEEFDLGLDDALPTGDDDLSDESDEDDAFEELTLDADATSSHRPMAIASTRQPFVSTQNIYKITKSSKSKSLKRSSSGAGMMAAAQPLLEIRLSKASTKTVGTEKQFNDVNAFRYITELFDQYQWNANDVRDDISGRCASDLDTFLHALADGKAWAAKGKCVYHKTQRSSCYHILHFYRALLLVRRSIRRSVGRTADRTLGRLRWLDFYLCLHRRFR